MIKKGQIYIHYKTGVAYEVIECENIYIQIKDEWQKAVRYAGIERDKEFVRSIKEFEKKFIKVER